MNSIRVSAAAWQAMIAHAVESYPEECCGAMLGREDEVVEAVRLENSFPGPRRARYEIRPEDLLATTREARDRGLRVAGIYHSHPDRDAYFSATDLENCCPWYAFVVLSVKGGELDHAACWRPNPDQTEAYRVTLDLPV